MARKDAAPAAGTPKPPSKLKQFVSVFKLTARYDKKAPFLIFGALLLVIAVSVTLSLLLSESILGRTLGITTGVLLAILVALSVLTRRADRAMFAQVDGQQGATSMALQSLRRGWSTEKEPVGVDPRSGDLVFRAVGRPGIVLLVEGPVPRTFKLADAERRRHSRVASGVPIHVIHVGNGPEQVPLRKVAGRVMRMKRQLNSAEVSAVSKRLQAIGGLRSPVPKGVDPFRARADRKAMRGR